ncbi:MAG: MtlR transcriptional regulator [Eubacteriales bacterium]|nr:MtlR transcriptional regulator [Eubacteriales bacterium]
MYKILSICGSGIATSTLVASRLKDGLEEHGITDISITEANVSEAGGLIENNPPDVIIHTTSLESVDLKGVKAFGAMPILLNLNAGALYKEIADYLKGIK